VTTEKVTIDRCYTVAAIFAPLSPKNASSDSDGDGAGYLAAAPTRSDLRDGVAIGWLGGAAPKEAACRRAKSCYIPLLYGIGDTAMQTAKLFWSGRSQAVRLPKEFRLPGAEVRIRRHGNAVILEPLADDWDWLDAIAGQLDEDFAQAVEEQPQEQQRPALDELFG
jgi:antitoxin VapB